MNIFGVGGWELLFVVLIAMIVLGPERVAKHMFTLGRWTRKMMVVYNQARAALRDELAGIDDGETLESFKQVRDDLQDVRRSINPRAIASDLNQSVRESVADINQSIANVQDENNILPPAPNAAPVAPPIQNNSIAPPPPAPSKPVEHNAWLPSADPDASTDTA